MRLRSRHAPWTATEQFTSVTGSVLITVTPPGIEALLVRGSRKAERPLGGQRKPGPLHDDGLVRYH